MSLETGITNRPLTLEAGHEMLSRILHSQEQDNETLLRRDETENSEEDFSYAGTECARNIEDELTNRRVLQVSSAVRPISLKRELPVTLESAATTLRARDSISNIIKGQDDRLIVMVGPCSIHNIKEGLNYAKSLLRLREKHHSALEIIMRTYLEKPRTTIGWKGLLNDPELSGNTNIGLGAILGRAMYLEQTEMGMPGGTEIIDHGALQFIDDVIALGAIGARDALTTRGRNTLSALSAPGSVKHATDGEPITGVQAAYAAAQSHTFLGKDQFGEDAEITSEGNPDVAVVLRGGSITGPNYGAQYVQKTVDLQKDFGLVRAVGIDTSHDNSGKDATRQIIVAEDLHRQLSAGQTALKLVMIESNTVAGKQDHVEARKLGKKLVEGQSITDACIDLAETEEILEMLAEGVRLRRAA